MSKQPLKLYVIRKYIRAKSANDAIKKDKVSPVDDVWMDDDFKKQLTSAIGFTVDTPQEYE